MAFCKECFLKMGTVDELNSYVFSDESEPCEGCGIEKPVLVSKVSDHITELMKILDNKD